MARLVENGMLQNVYRLQIMNATESTHRYQFQVSGLENAKVGFKGQAHTPYIKVLPAEARWVVVDVAVPDGSVPAGKHKIEFHIQSLDGPEIVSEDSVFLAPR